MPGRIIAVNDLVKVRIVSQLEEQVAINTLFYKCFGVATTSAHESDMATAFDTAVAAAYKSCLTNSAIYRGVGVQVQNPTLSVEQETIASQGDGVGGVGFLPKQIAVIIHFQSAIAGPKGRGRIYVPFVPTLFNVLGKPTAAAILDYAALALAIPQIMVIDGGGGGTASMELVVRNARTLNGYSVDTKTAQGLFATQRRRGDYGRINSPPF
jgi:hypothetical protein